MANNSGRVTLSRNPEKILRLAVRIFGKHQSDGNVSLLKTLADNDWDVTGPKVAGCLEKHLQAEELRRQAEIAIQERDKVMSEIENIVRNSAALLKGVYRKTPSKLTDWGFEVDSSPKATKPKAIKP